MDFNICVVVVHSGKGFECIKLIICVSYRFDSFNNIPNLFTHYFCSLSKKKMHTHMKKIALLPSKIYLTRCVAGSYRKLELHQ